MNETNELKLKKVNARIMALYIFQFGILQPICIIVNSQTPIAVFSLFLFIFMFFKNGMKVKTYVIFTLMVIMILFSLNILIYQSNSFVVPMLFEFLIMGFSGFLIGSLDFDGQELYKSFLRFSIVNFFILAPFPFIGFLDKIEYMRFGYALLPSIIMTFYGAVYGEKHKVSLGIISILALAIMTIYGSRGTLVAVMLSLLLVFIFSKRVSGNTKILILIMVGVFIIITTRYSLIYRFLNYIYYNLGIQTYSIKKLIVMYTDGLIESSSGREKIYLYLWDLFLQNPIIGNGIGISQAMLGERFTAHNIFLQILVETGILGLLVWLMLWIRCGYKYNHISKEQRIGTFVVVTMLISVSLGRLLVSSDMWTRPEYWFVFSLLINYKTSDNIKNIGVSK